jgi:NADH-ubiquinone oxidoreductase chain 5
MYLVIVFLPLYSFLSAALFGRFIGNVGSAIVTVISIFLTFIFSLIAFYEIGLNKAVVYINLNSWISTEFFNVDWGFLFDSLTTTMCCVVTFISFLVHLYSTEYMSHDPHLPRFMSYLSLFTFFMLILVSADNYVQMFVGWEGVGLCSYLLINFWFTRIQANKAAIKAMLVNRVGDFGLALGIMTMFLKYKAVDYATIFSLTPFFLNELVYFFNIPLNYITLIGILLFIGAVGKSAQLGLHTWLPDAMEGPTPVSALIHAATMVTAGVFLIARSSALFEFSSKTLAIVTFLGACTSFFAATTGLLQNDLKKVIAYSTCSQLGYMVFACGLSNYSIGVFHLSNHAFFKALLFLSAGSVIHAVSDEQDMRKMGGLRLLIPFTYSIMLVGSLALIGFPFLTGFYSKDAILEVAYGKFTYAGLFSYILGTVSAFLTAFYSTRLLYLTFLSKPNGYKPVIFNVKESSYQINFSLLVLTIPSIFIGFYTKDMLIGLGTDFWGNSIFVLPKNMNRVDAEFIEQFIKLTPVALSILGVLSAYFLYTFQDFLLFKFKISTVGKFFFNFFNRKWFFDKVFNEQITQSLMKFSYRTCYKIIDRGIIEILGPYGFSKVILKESSYLYSFQTGHIFHYTLIILSASTIFLGLKEFLLIIDLQSDFRIFSLFFFFITFLLNIKKM